MSDSPDGGFDEAQYATYEAHFVEPRSFLRLSRALISSPFGICVTHIHSLDALYAGALAHVPVTMVSLSRLRAPNQSSLINFNAPMPDPESNGGQSISKYGVLLKVALLRIRVQC